MLQKDYPVHPWENTCGGAKEFSSVPYQRNPGPPVRRWTFNKHPRPALLRSMPFTLAASPGSIRFITL